MYTTSLIPDHDTLVLEYDRALTLTHQEFGYWFDLASDIINPPSQSEFDGLPFTLYDLQTNPALVITNLALQRMDNR